MTRRTFQTAVAAGTLAAGTLAATAAGADDEGRDYPAPKFKPSFKKPQLGKLLVQDFVIFAHSELDMVKKLWEKEPALINATMDWGGGDWETALGGASHMGRRDIAEFLIDKGARVDIFAAAMLGHLDAVKALLTAHPRLLDTKGPHGIPLITHAKMGGKPAAEVLAYLESLKADSAKPAAPAKAGPAAADKK
jgi:hypothetical protein